MVTMKKIAEICGVSRGTVDRALNGRGRVNAETAQNIFSDFASDRLRNSYSDSEPVSDKYLNCDLLIMDDLGTEMISQFSVSCLYNIINTRLNKNLPIIASTNLSSEELRKVYQDRITSRLFGNFYIKLFVGKDVRQQKI